MLTVVNSWMMILDVFSNLNNSMIFQWALCIKIRTEIAKPIFFPQFYFFGIFHGSSTILWGFFLEGRTKQLMPYIQVLLFSCRKCPHSDKQDFNLQAWHRMKFHRVIKFNALLNLQPDFSVATASCQAG